MARINTYAIDDNVTSQDKWIGTDVAGNVTKNFTPENVANWINKTNAVGIAGQSNFKFQVDLSPERLSGTISFELGSGDGTAFSAINNIIISKYGGDGNLILDYLENLVGTYILLCQVDDTNNFGVYQLGSLTQLENEPNFYNAVLSVQSSNGTLTANEYYGVVAYPASSIVSVTGLEAIDEGNGVGWRLIGRDPDNYGNIGLNAIDFSNSDAVSTERGSTGRLSVTFGENNINQQTGSIVLGQGQSAKITDIYQGSNIITGYNSSVWGATYSSLIAVNRSTIGVEGTNYTTNAIYQNVIVGDGINYYAGRDSGAVGGGLISGSTGVFTVGVANEDLTTTTSNWETARYNNYGPRFIVGCGTFTPTTGVASVRQNGFVVMSDGTATFPILTNAKIDAAGDYSAVTKGWVNTATANNVDGSGTVNYIPKWTDTDTIGNSIIQNIGNNVGINLTPSIPGLTVNGNIFATGGNYYIDSDRYLFWGNNSANIKGISGNSLQFSGGIIGGSTQMILTAGGNVGIGTTSPSQGLHVVDAGGIVAEFESSNNSVSTMQLTNSSGDSAYFGVSGTSLTLGVGAFDSNDLRITSGGNVGIGTISPIYKLDVNGEIRSDGLRLNLSATTQRAVTSTGADSIQIGDAGVNDIRFKNVAGTVLDIKSSGYVGIGTTSPTLGRLHVAQSSDSVTSGIAVEGISGGNSMRLWLDGSTRKINAGGASTMIQFDTSQVAFPNGNVGIGTTSPVKKLDIIGTNGNQFRISNTENDLTLKNAYHQVRHYNNAEEDFLWSLAQSDPSHNTLYLGGSSSVANAATKIKFYTAANNTTLIGSERMIIDSSGNVGIGTTNPQQKLHVLGYGFFADATNTRGIRLEPTNANQQIITTGGNLNLIANTGTVNIYNGSVATNLTFFDGSTSAYTVNIDSNGNTYFNGGNVGIGTANPTSKLHVSGSTYSTGGFYTPDSAIGYFTNSSSTAGMVTTALNDTTFNSGGAETMRLTASGNVGIGTTSPAQTLDVSGSVIFRPSGTSDTISFLSLGSAQSRLVTTGNFAIWPGGNEAIRLLINGYVGVGTAAPASKLDVNGGIRMADDTATASATNEGTLRYRKDANNSYIDMCMQTGASTYAWVNIKTNTW